LKIGVLEMKKYFKTVLLSSAVISASLFMIIESGEYYQRFYDNPYQGYWSAFLVESFLAIASMLYFKNRKLLNTMIKLVMIPLFLVVVGGASLKVVSPMVNELAQTENKNKLVALLQTENKQSIENLERLKGQKVNTAVEIRRQRQSTSELKEVLKADTTFSWMIWVVIGFSTFLRFSVQIANLVFAHSLGVVWREPKATTTESSLKSINKNVVQLKSKPQLKDIPSEVPESQMF
jgi:hypothetical protein